MTNGRRMLAAERLFDGERLHGPTTVVIEKSRVADLRKGVEKGAETLPAGHILAPGFVDTQVNGGGGVQFNDALHVEGLELIAQAHRALGTTAILPTLISDNRGNISKAISAVAEARRERVPGILGIHIEGPFINPARKGVHPADHILQIGPDDVALLSGLGSLGITLVTLAPELAPPGLIRALVQAGVKVSVGHSDGTLEDVQRAVAEGLTGATHLYNAMSQLSSRAPGVVGAVMADDRIVSGIIPDGHHMADAALKIAFRAKGTKGLMLVSDAMAPVGTDLKEFSLFGIRILVEGDRLATESGTLAGAAIDMAAAVRGMVARAGATPAEALRMATLTPAEFLGLDSEIGRIAPGARADLVVLDEGLRVRAVI